MEQMAFVGKGQQAGGSNGEVGIVEDAEDRVRELNVISSQCLLV
jgi:hypothetical protein